MKNTQVNIFIINTPFQEYISSLIVSSNFDSEYFDNYFVFSVDREPKRIIGSINYYRLSHGILAIRDVLKVKRLFMKSRKYGENCTFFLPHINNLLSNYIYNSKLFLKNQIAIYYEGIALFQPNEFRLKLSRKKEFKRRFIAFITGIKYQSTQQLIPDDLKRRANVYTPLVLDLEQKYKRVIHVQFPIREIEKTLDILIIGPKWDKNNYLSVKEKLENMISHIKKTEHRDLYYQPHFETKIPIDQISEFFFDHSVVINIINDTDIAENIVLKYPPKCIYSTYLSSALVNIALIFKNQIPMYITGINTLKWNRLTDSCNITFLS